MPKTKEATGARSPLIRMGGTQGEFCLPVVVMLDVCPEYHSCATGDTGVQQPEPGA